MDTVDCVRKCWSYDCLRNNWGVLLMNSAHVFFKEGKLYLIPELPIKPKHIDIFSKSSTDKFYEYEKKLAEAKANALPVVNPDAIDELYLQSILEGKFYKWPGTWEKTTISLYTDNYRCKEDIGYAAKLIAPQQPQAENWQATPKKKKPLDEKLNSLSSKISHAKRVIKDEKGLPIGFEPFNKTPMTQSDAPNEGREEKIIFPVHPGDWPEDFDHENGNYIGLCRECGHSFRGHKRRFICKICMQPDWENIAKIKKPEDKGKGPFEGCWQEGEMVGYAKCMITKVRELRDQLSKERENSNALEVRINSLIISKNRELEKEREMRKELVSTINQLTRGSAFLEKKVEFLIKRASELDKNKG